MKIYFVSLKLIILELTIPLILIDGLSSKEKSSLSLYKIGQIIFSLKLLSGQYNMKKIQKVAQK